MAAPVSKRFVPKHRHLVQFRFYHHVLYDARRAPQIAAHDPRRPGLGAMRQTRLGIAAIGQSLAMANTTSAKHAIKRVDRFPGNLGVDLEVAQADLIQTVIRSARRVYLTLD